MRISQGITGNCVNGKIDMHQRRQCSYTNVVH